MELDVDDGCAVHVVLDQQRTRRAQVEERHAPARRADRAVQARIVKAHSRQAVPGLHKYTDVSEHNYM